MYQPHTTRNHLCREWFWKITKQVTAFNNQKKKKSNPEESGEYDSQNYHIIIVMFRCQQKKTIRHKQKQQSIPHAKKKIIDCNVP